MFSNDTQPIWPRFSETRVKNDPPDGKAGRLLELSEEVSRIAGSLTRVSIGLRASVQQFQPSSNSNQPDVLLKWVSWLISARRKRANYVAHQLFGEPAWDMLLNLLRAELAYEPLSVASACTAAGISPSTGLRWLNALENHGLVVQEGSGRDANSNFVALSPDASNSLRRYLVDGCFAISHRSKGKARERRPEKPKA